MEPENGHLTNLESGLHLAWLACVLVGKRSVSFLAWSGRVLVGKRGVSFSASAKRTVAIRTILGLIVRGFEVFSYKFDVGWAGDVLREDGMDGFTSWIRI